MRAESSWRWDATLFAGTAPYYVRGRLPYAPRLAEVIATALGLDGRGRLLDVGCGPGTVTLTLAPHFEVVVGLDPDPDMLVEAARQAERRQIGNAQWAQRRAEELPAGLGDFRLVTFAASFHWLDRLQVARAVRSMLERGGVAMQIDAPAYRPDELLGAAGLPHPAPPHAAIDQLRQTFLGPDRRAGQGIRNSSPDNEDAVFQSAGFHPAESLIVPDGRVFERSVDELVASVLSTSSTAPHLFGDRLVEFEADLRALLRAASLSNRFALRLPVNVLRIWRP
jgi:SAM-dependent methyltransferase